ncbi:MAG: S-layer homology domain-containing protein [Oscillospiraceae bacterium]|nr:S-layer homology domain-containing protein [Oscillospiraceae bacterium]
MKKLLRRFCALLCALALCFTFTDALTVQEAIELLEYYYVSDLPEAVYQAETLDELFAALGDPYTYYMDEEAYQEFHLRVEGDTVLIGIGAGVEYTADGIRIISILPDSGAEKAGLQPDDIIIGVDGVSCVPASEQLRDLIIGEVGTGVNITVKHTDGTVCDYHIVRQRFYLQNTVFTIKDGVGTIDCGSFGGKTMEYFFVGIDEYDDEVDQWVVDLRDNTGGLADAAVGVLGALTGREAVLYYRVGDGRTLRARYKLDAETEKPIIVLVNGYSASASEIVAGDIRAARAGIIIGSRTYGKGTAQQTFDETTHPDIFHGDSLKITVYRFYCADGCTTDRIGVLPTLRVADKYTADVARLLSAVRPEGDCLVLRLNGNRFFVDLEQAQTDRFADAFTELLSALPPDADVAFETGAGERTAISAAQALVRYGDAAAWRGFSDVTDSAFANEINTLGTYGILLGDGKGSFAPTDKLTRAQFCAMLAQALNISGGTKIKASGLFSDVPDGMWYSEPVNAIASMGFINGVGKNRFDPEGTLTQEQFITIMGRLVRFLNFYADDYAMELTDEQLAAEKYAALRPWARTGASVMSDSGEQNMLYADLREIDPDSEVTREQAAATLCITLKALNLISY